MMDIRLEDFVAVVEQTTDLARYPHADRVEQQRAGLRRRPAPRGDGDRRRAATSVGAELVRAFTDGPGVVVFAGAFPDPAVSTGSTEVFDEIIADEAAAGGAAGDHFAKPGANSRVWNALEKLAVRAPEAFVDYYANDVIALASSAWLGPGYQVTSQVNVVRPGGKAQEPHRDYHLGFLDRRGDRALPDPRARAVAGADPAGRGRAHATCRWRAGRRCTCRTRTSTSPATSPGGATDFKRVLRRAPRPAAAAQGRRRVLQPRAVPRRRLQRLDRHPADGQPAAGLLGVRPGDGAGGPGAGGERRLPGAPDESSLGADGLAAAVAASAEGYPFPTNLDLDQPVDGLTPVTQAELVHRALDEGWEPTALSAAIADYSARRRTC